MTLTGSHGSASRRLNYHLQPIDLLHRQSVNSTRALSAAWSYKRSLLRRPGTDGCMHHRANYLFQSSDPASAFWRLDEQQT